MNITKLDVHVGVRLCREANPHRALSMHPQQVTDTCEGSGPGSGCALHSRPLATPAATAGNGLRSEHRCRLVRYLNCLSAMLHHSMTEWILGRLDLDGVILSDSTVRWLPFWVVRSIAQITRRVETIPMANAC